MEEGKRNSPRRSHRILSDVDTSNQKVYRRSRMRINDGPNFNLEISQVSGEQNKEERIHVHCKGKKRLKEVNNAKKSKKRCVDFASMSKKIVDTDDDFEDLPPQFQ
ncbi:hypothetical protein R3W88_010088 [Solanum pinnatisectum]|uniref:Uncharacterized protein n=1 Tax=Solanum pinnatisectum TaxID=50273 RepID=A0AAV9MES9_9SOLN|nr:hypothetical protein R3W88_010088 [Solanum pinnatisectum]